MEIGLKSCFDDPALNVMNFLNEVILQFPRAISFAPGRPNERFFDIQAYLAGIDLYVEHRSESMGLCPESVIAGLGQYNQTNGIIRDQIARHLEADEQIMTSSEYVVVTCGCQEGMNLLLMSLFKPGHDVLLVSEPTYIGITALADVLAIEVMPVQIGEEGVKPAALAAAIKRVRRSGGRPRAFYDVPDFNNPMGTSMPLGNRQDLLELAAAEDVLIIEDSAYRMYGYDGDPYPTLKAMDEHGVVVLMGTFSKTLCPGLRIGYLLADQTTCVPGREAPSFLAAELSKVKGLTSVNTSPLLQAAVGGVLLRTGGSLKPIMEPKVAFYRHNRDTMLSALHRHLEGISGVQWNRPAGGFFVALQLPFVFDHVSLRRCAEDFGVIVCPMASFAREEGYDRMVRLSFSYVTPEEIDDGIERLARFILSNVR